MEDFETTLYGIFCLTSMVIFVCTCICLWQAFESDNNMRADHSFVGLMARNITSVFKEMVFIKVLFILFSLTGFVYLLYILHSSPTKELMKADTLSAIAAIVAPVATYAFQGFTFPKDRKLNILYHLFYKVRLSDEEAKLIRET